MAGSSKGPSPSKSSAAGKNSRPSSKGAKKSSDPFDVYNQGTISFSKPHPTYGDSYTDRRERVKAVAQNLRDKGYTVGSSAPGMWTVKSGPKPKQKAKGRKR